MTRSRDPGTSAPHAVIIGAGIGGLATAARLSGAGLRVTVLERHGHPGGKMRTMPSAAGPVDAGPTVLTMRPVFEDLFTALGTRLTDHVTLHRQHLLARHFWPDGSTLDLFDDPDANIKAVAAFAGARAGRQMRKFSDRARALFEGFDAPVMQSPEPTLAALTSHVLRHPHLIRQMASNKTLAQLLDSSFSDPRLVQLFGRYATYVGGSPYHVPALLALIWQAEVSGVWVVEGGLHRLAQALADAITTRGGEFLYDTHVDRIFTEKGRAIGVTLQGGTFLPADAVVFNGDPRALATGAFGPGLESIAPQTTEIPRSLSAEVWAFAARPSGPDLAHHNVFFRADPRPEFDALMQGRRVPDPTLYVCAMDRGLPASPPTLERFEIIANAPPLQDPQGPEEFTECQTRTFRTLARFGLDFDPLPGPDALTTPPGFDRLFPESSGSLYGQSPHGTMAAFQRPTARTTVKGLYLAGGGVHPGAGVPMAALSGRHAAEAILTDPISTSPSRPTATHGGMSTA
ncbi:1-hydroxycarotenoid 3,4-desaturase CrtD [Roseovarius atlanticus]|uniref:1-hydroxycarotenoid 3,4-desaturase CrtD n=1 Tax=Roseovarius atlanticus TaxID=1641875 RepID=UPI001C95C6B1|nr:1-hydroxycarotenoid 3,4-desaturase CrtD [Roseovarius atlanticus]MBY5990455.1 phytoene desaturase [Roseovarius atlanticus]MBY6127001.1 phytoene desaturase [Roseovarius atlanticus]MBY6151494.1 phytoene desaturase [Roseovarius atlanticus]